ncbi:MAG TPA: phytanoyl-CoA dioxygenase family protein [Burkholderiales bacterium]|nr:phytanoyl-CoA dioxygenase family protein [Burkholderiales bacterium]
MSDTLSDQELEHYREQGYVIPRYRLPAVLLDRLRRTVDQVLASYTDVAQEDLANPHMIPPSEGPQVNPFLEAARHPPVLDMVQRVLGPDLILWITRLLCKPALTGREVPWHQDGEYWLMRPLATCSVWIAIDPVSTANGCMRFIPGSHNRQELYRHHVTDRANLVLDLELDRDQFDESRAVNVELEPGQMSLHDVRMIHGSAANTSGQRRAALILRYMPATSHYDRSLAPKRSGNRPFDIAHQPLWLVRGVDRCGKNDLVHGHEQWRQRYTAGLTA